MPCCPRWHKAGHCAAAIAFGIPIIRATIEENDPHMMFCDRYRPPPGLGLEIMCVLVLCGPAPPPGAGVSDSVPTGGPAGALLSLPPGLTGPLWISAASGWAGERIKTLKFDVGTKFDTSISNCVELILRTPCPQKLTRLSGDPLSITNRNLLIGPDQFAPVVRTYSSLCCSHTALGGLTIAFKNA